jgi:hypothetical protein
MSRVAGLIALVTLAASVVFGQTSTRKPDLRPNAVEGLPEWMMSDDEFKSLLLQIEAVLPIYDSSLKDLETYISRQQNLPYRAGKAIQDGVNDCRSDIDEIRKAIASLRTSRDVLEEIHLANSLRNIVRDESDLERDEMSMTLAEYELDLTFPSPSGLRGSDKQFVSLEGKIEVDYSTRIMVLETQLSQCRAAH